MFIRATLLLISSSLLLPFVKLNYFGNRLKPGIILAINLNAVVVFWHLYVMLSVRHSSEAFLFCHLQFAICLDGVKKCIFSMLRCVFSSFQTAFHLTL